MPPSTETGSEGSPVVLAAGGKVLGVATARLVSDVGSYVRTTSAPPPQIRLADL